MKRISVISLLISFVLISSTVMIWQKSTGSSYPGTGDWTITSGQSYVIDQDCQIVGNIYNYGNLTFKDCTIYINNSFYILYSYDGSNLNFSNVVIRGRDSTGGTNYGALQLRFYGNSFSVTKCEFRTMKNYPIFSTKSFSVKNCIFDTLPSGIRGITAMGNTITGNITDCTFQNIPDDWSVSIEGESSYLAYGWNISNNQLYNSKGFNFEQLHNSTMQSNLFSNPLVRAIDFIDNCNNNIVRFNTISNPQIAIEIANSKEITVSNTSFTGVKTAGIYLANAQNTVIANITMSIFSGDGIYDYNSGNFHNYINDSHFYLLNNNQIKQAINLGHYFPSTNYIHVDNDTKINDVAIVNFENLDSAAMDLQNVKYSKVMMTNCRLVSLSNVTVENADGFFFGGNQNCTISNINALANHQEGIRIDRCFNNTLHNFTSSNNRKEGLLTNYPPTWAIITNNKYLHGNCSGNMEEGAQLKSEILFIFQNITLANNYYGGLFMDDVHNGTFINCSFVNNSLEGAYLTNCENHTFNSNFFSYNGQSNLYLSGSTKMTYVTMNEFIQPLNQRFNIQNFHSSNNIYRNHYSDYFGFDDTPQDGYGDTPYWTNGSIAINDTSPIVDDADKDKLDRLLEAYYGTDSLNNDTDFDGLTDFQELFPQIAFSDEISQGLFRFYLIPTDPLNNDTDLDTISDFDEINGTFGYRSNPCNRDTDYDGFYDQDEIAHNTSPIDPNKWPGKPNVPVIEYNNYDSTEPEPIRSVKSVPGYPPWIILICCMIGIFKYVMSIKRKIRRVNYE